MSVYALEPNRRASSVLFVEAGNLVGAAVRGGFDGQNRRQFFKVENILWTFAATVRENG
jgi:hypothetical protein